MIMSNTVPEWLRTLTFAQVTALPPGSVKPSALPSQQLLVRARQVASF
jgi:hypothetical protein